MDSKELKNWMQKNLRKKLGKDYDYIVDYFETLNEDTADYIILISRRCYILYQMFDYVLGWKRKNVISDKGMWCNRLGLSKAVRVIIADDLMFSGVAVSHILNKMNIYLNSGCIRKVAVFCRYNNCRSSVEGNPVKAYSVRTDRDCKNLTNKLVKSIQSNGIPYAVFVYSLYGVEKDQGIDLCSDIQHVESSNIFDNSENKWVSIIYFNFIDEIKVLTDAICDEVCLRVYRKEAQKLICTIPFAFLKDIKREWLDKYFAEIQDCFENAGSKLIAAEIDSALKWTLDNCEDTVEIENEKFVYLASMLTCCLSRVVGILFDVEYIYKEKINSISDNIISGSFSKEVVNELSEMDKKFAVCFISELERHKDILRECVQENKDNVCLGSPYKELVEQKSVGKGCADILVDIFEFIREEYNKSKVADTKYISCDKIMSLLQAYSKEEIYAAEISAWDQGIATYDFWLDNMSGLKSRCGIGERSQLIFSFKYHSVLRNFFEQLPCDSNEYTQRQMDSDLDSIFNEIKELSLTENEKEMIRRVAHSGIVNLYNYFIEI